MAPKSFQGTPEAAAAAFNPWVTPPQLSKSGVPLGIDLKTHRIILLDPWQMKVERVLHSTVLGALGQKDHGKSALMKSLALRLMTMQAGHDPNTRIRISDRKPEAGEPEYAPLTRFLHSRVVSLQKMSINILDPQMGLTESDVLACMVDLIEQDLGRGLQGFEPLALQVAVGRMMTEQNKPQSGLRTLGLISRSLDVSDVRSYHAMLDADAMAAFDYRPELMTMFQASPPDKWDTVLRGRFLEDAAMIAQHVDWVHHGPYGEIFGDTQSLRDALTQAAVTLDWTGVNDSAQALLESRLWDWSKRALALNDLEMIPHVELLDEEHEVVANVAHARARATFIRKARAFHTLLIMATQYITDFTQAGEADSEIRGLARGMVSGMGGFFVGLHPNQDDILHDLTTTLQMSDHDAAFTQQLPVGCHYLVVPGRPAVLFQHILTDQEWPLIDTGSAGRRMTDRTPVLSTKQIAHIAATRGVIASSELFDQVPLTADELAKIAGNGAHALA